MSKPKPRSRPLRVVCMPVGPQNVVPDTVQMIAGLAAARTIDATLMARAHLITARNGAWAAALKVKAKRVLWCDSDVWCDPTVLGNWLDKQDRFFDSAKIFGSVGAVVRRRGSGYAYQYDEHRTAPLWLGLGLVYWDVDRVVGALNGAARDEAAPFRWIPPMGEDYEISNTLHVNGAWQALDPELPTWHDGIGHWEGAKVAPGMPGSEKAIGKAGR